MAAEQKLIPTSTIFLVDGTSISITSLYDEDLLPDTIKAFIGLGPGTQDSVSYIEGDLVIEVKHYLDHLSYQLDLNGNLILTINTGDEELYSIDENGNLTYLLEI